MYFCHLFSISYASVRSILFLSFIVPIFAWNVPLVCLIFLKRSLVFLILLFSSITLHCSLGRLSYSYLCLLFFGTLHSDGCIFPFLLCLSLLFSVICKASSDNHFAFLHFFFLGIVLVTTSCTMSQTSIYGSSGTLSIRYNPLNLFVTSTKLLSGFWFRSYLEGLVIFPTFFNLSLKFAIQSAIRKHSDYV